jgi:hypothetical protein
MAEDDKKMVNLDLEERMIRGHNKHPDGFNQLLEDQDDDDIQRRKELDEYFKKHNITSL